LPEATRHLESTKHKMASHTSNGHQTLNNYPYSDNSITGIEINTNPSEINSGFGNCLYPN